MVKAVYADDSWKSLLEFKSADSAAFFGDTFSRSGFVIINAPEKCGKSTLILELALTAVFQGLKVAYFEGASKYGEHNWEKGIPESNLCNHALHHCFRWLAGDKSEEHATHLVWNVFTLLHFKLAEERVQATIAQAQARAVQTQTVQEQTVQMEQVKSRRTQPKPATLEQDNPLILKTT